jgi:hypothetical protein
VVPLNAANDVPKMSHVFAKPDTAEQHSIVFRAGHSVEDERSQGAQSSASLVPIPAADRFKSEMLALVVRSTERRLLRVC